MPDTTDDGNVPETMTHMVFLSGEFTPRTQAHIPAFDRGFLYGDGFFETTRISDGAAMHLGLHLERLCESCRKTGWQWTPPQNVLTTATAELIKKNSIETGYLRITVSRGLHRGGLSSLEAVSPSVLIEARKMVLPPLDCVPALKMIRSDYRRNEHSPTVQFKTLSYQDNILALAEARERGAKEVYFLNMAGHVAEGAISNIFWTRNDRIFTPEKGCGLLPGITRGIIMNIAEEESITCLPGKYDESDLLAADEVFCTNSLKGVTPVGEIQAGESIVKWNKWPLTRHLAMKYAG